MIENVGRMAGMPVGPLALNDEVAVDLAGKSESDRGRSRCQGDRPAAEKALQEMVEKRGRFGRKNGKGFLRLPGERAEESCGPSSPISAEESLIQTRSTSRS
jgi:3-hydroxyacyl-CoA dehydrogenase/enoyl-CoA hydratase/3-hydroxybutyryl-CoA epimerase